MSVDKHLGLVQDFQEILHHRSVQAEKRGKDPGVTMDCFTARLSHEYDRKILMDYETKIPSCWEEHLKLNPHLFNGSKFRLYNLESEQTHVLMNLGLTCYRDFICTNMSNDRHMLMDHGKKFYNDQQACLSDKLGVGTLVLSADDKVLLMQRSMLLGEEQGMLGVPGGHPEPKVVGIEDISGVGEGVLASINSQDVIHEIFYSNIKEVRDEVNIPEKYLSWPKLLGMFRENGSGLPNASFLVRCSLTGDEIQTLYKQGGPEAYESTDIFLVDLQDVIDYSSSPIMQRLLPNSTPTTKASIYFFIT